MNWHDYFTYDAESGDLTWRERPREAFPSKRAHSAWNALYSGSAAGYRHRDGKTRKHTITVSVNKKPFQAHRIIWEMHHGPIPSGMVIDHINGNPWDNRISNLRLATQAQNCCNRAIRSDSGTGIKGVSFHAQSGKWRAHIQVSGKRRHLGAYSSKNEAANARAKAANELHKEFQPQQRT